MMKTLLSAAAMSILIGSAASAMPMPASPSDTAVKSPDIVKVRRGDDDDWRHERRHWRRHHAYEDRDDWRRHNYHRYSHRPHHWRDRGCFSVGPFWYCS